MGKAKAKNPRRQAPAYRKLVGNQISTRRVVWLLWAVPLVLFIVGITFRWHPFFLFLAGLAVLSGVIQHALEASRLRDFRAKLAEVESRLRNDGEG